MPSELREAHRKLNRAVDEAFGLDVFQDMEARQIKLFSLYRDMVG